MPEGVVIKFPHAMPGLAPAIEMLGSHKYVSTTVITGRRRTARPFRSDDVRRSGAFSCYLDLR